MSQHVPNKLLRLIRLRRLCRLKRRGASAVEFAVIAPVFFLLVFGMIEYGRLIMVQQIITNGSREGAREAVLDGATDATVRTEVQSYLTGSTVDPNDVIVSFNTTPQSTVDGDPITVTLSIDFTEVSWLPGQWFLGNTTMSAQTTMRRETSGAGS